MEIIIVALLLGVMSLVLFSSVNTIIVGKDLVENQSGAARTARYIFSRLTEELSSRYPENVAGEEADTEGRNSRLKKRYMLGKNKRDGETHLDSLSFVTTRGGQEVFAGNGNYGVISVTYRLQEASDENKYRSNKEGRTFVLVREEAPAGVDEDATIKEQRVVFPLAENVSGFNVRYLSNRSWQDSWTGAKAPFPDAVEITLAIAGAKGKVERYRSAVRIAPIQTDGSSRSGQRFTGFGGGNANDSNVTAQQ